MYKQREIVLVPFPYSDLSAIKRRPVLVLSNDSYNNQFPDLLVCVITSNLYKDHYSVSLDNTDLESGFLPASSVIKCHKLFTIDQSQIIRRFSTLQEQKFSDIINVIHKLIQ